MMATPKMDTLIDLKDLKPHHELHRDGTAQGRDPRRMAHVDLLAANLTPTNRGGAIRAKCLDCMVGAEAEVRRCADASCALWPFRMGGDPWREKRVLTPEHMAALHNKSLRAVSEGGR